MGKYTRYSARVPPKPRPWRIHPIWRGIGCLLFLVIPFLGYAGGVVLVRMNMERGWLVMPPEFMRPIELPFLGIQVDHLLANLLAALVFTVSGYGILMFFYTIFYGFLGPKRFSGLDAAPIRKNPNWKRRH